MTADYLELPPAGPQVVVRAHVDLPGSAGGRSGGGTRPTVELVGGVYDASGKPVGAPFGRQHRAGPGVGE